ncbi:MAG: FHA domain-containing protein, partial [Streptosporangiaceae bacterium]
MPPERFDWSDRRPPQASPSPAGLAPAGLAEAAQPQGGAGGVSAPDLEVRTRRSVHQMKAGTTYHIGRDPKSDIVMTDSRVSWRHGELLFDGGTWIIKDLGSTNGTFLGLRRLDRIEIGAECVVRLGNPDDGPVLRCVPQVPAAAGGQAGSPPADHPGTALAGSPAPPAPSAPEAAPRPDPESWWPPVPEAVPGSPPGGVSP